MAISLYWWKGSNYGTLNNFGDALSPLIVQFVTGQEVRYAPPRTADLVAAGSLLGHVFRDKWKRILSGRLHPTTVWGTGAIDAARLRPTRWLRCLAVRGALTRDALELKADTPLGDPGLLLSRMVERPPQSHARWGIIPHYIERSEPVMAELVAMNPGARVIDMTDPDVLRTTRRIAECEFVVSSSLHGLIAADAFQVPNVWGSWSDRVNGDGWKFRDYASSVGRTLNAPAVRGAVALSTIESLAHCADPALVRSRCDVLQAALASQAS